METENRIEVAKRAVMAQTDLLHREFGRARRMTKSDGSQVTPVDIAISEDLQRTITAAFPDDEFFSEELADAAGPALLRARFAWVLDPIDGTDNYAAGVPFCAISLGLLEHGVPVYGIIYDLCRRVLMHGGPGRGLWNGGEAAQVRPEPPHALSLIGFHTPVDEAFAQAGTRVIRDFKIRELGSATLHLAYVAAGMLDGVVGHNVKVWDVAAACALCAAGRGEVCFLDGDLFPLRKFDVNMGGVRYVAGNPVVCSRLKAIVAGEVLAGL